LCTALREHQGLTPLVFLLDWEHATPATVKSVIICLMNCSRRDVNIRDGICQEGGVPSIVGLMGKEQERILVEKATWTLNNLSTGSRANQVRCLLMRLTSVLTVGGVTSSTTIVD
jgi:hypothetical protein